MFVLVCYCIISISNLVIRLCDFTLIIFRLILLYAPICKEISISCYLTFLNELLVQGSPGTPGPPGESGRDGADVS